MSVFRLIFLPAKFAALTWVPTIEWLSVYCSMSGTPDSDPESGKSLLVESRIWEFFLGFLLVEFEFEGFGICNPAWIIRDPANDWNPESKFHWQGIRTSIAWNPEATATTCGESRILDWVGLPRMGLADLDESGETNEDFLLNTLKTHFRISRVRVLSDLYECIINGAKKFVSARSGILRGTWVFLEITRASVLFSRKL